MNTVETKALLEQLQSLSNNNPNFAVVCVDLVLKIAVGLGASDIHWHPTHDAWDIRIRVDGVVQRLVQLRRSEQTDPVMRLKVLAHLLTYQTVLPQEGRLDFDNADFEARISSFPTVYGERAVIRLLPRRKFFNDLDQLGFTADIVTELRQLMREKDGAVLITGSAGSGKTTTLYTLLHELIANENIKTVLTVEDPVEAVIEGISQTSLNPSAGFDFSTALRSVLRQDPEVLVVGEVRDPDSAEAALRAALTGHLVFTTLHASDAATALRRLQELGLPQYLIRSGLKGILCQRLVRRLCVHCRELAPEDAAIHQLSQAWRQHGCEHCIHSGYRGRIAIAELMRIDQGSIADAIADAIEHRRSAREIYQLAMDAGMQSMLQRARHYVAAGLTSISELYRSFGVRIQPEMNNEASD